MVSRARKRKNGENKIIYVDELKGMRKEWVGWMEWYERIFWGFWSVLIRRGLKGLIWLSRVLSFVLYEEGVVGC